MCVHMCVCMYIYTQVCTYVCVHACIYICIASGLTFARNRRNSMRDYNLSFVYFYEMQTYKILILPATLYICAVT